MAEIVIRKAVDSDIEEIWELLRAEREMWSTDRILAGIDGLFVVINKQRIVCVINGIFSAGKCKIDWVAVHPMFPKSSVTLAAICGLCGILYRKPASDIALLNLSDMEGVMNAF
jgi:N-acetylglutamate synthase-like GNAT family acetyltransferase